MGSDIVFEILHEKLCRAQTIMKAMVDKHKRLKLLWVFKYFTGYNMGLVGAMAYMSNS